MALAAGDAAAAPGEALAGARGAQLSGERSAALQAAEGGRWDFLPGPGLSRGFIIWDLHFL